ncbi:unannotated protein [freshwater metagenome]|uniref:Unannotated protein n=1 Tax=freshwater metagenome TaxID=449393 RepID=A0A6J6GT14_9ZZZZ
MDEPAALRVIEGVGRFDTDMPGLSEVESGPGVEQSPKRSAGQHLGDEIGNVTLSPVVHRHHVRMVQRRSGLRFRPESLQERRVSGESIMKHLDRDTSTQNHVVGEVNGGGCPGADGSEQPVATPEYLTDPVGGAGDGHSPRVVVGCSGFGHPGPTRSPPTPTAVRRAAGGKLSP